MLVERKGQEMDYSIDDVEIEPGILMHVLSETAHNVNRRIIERNLRDRQLEEAQQMAEKIYYA